MVDVAALPPGAPARVIAELEALDPTTLTKPQRTALASARVAAQQESRSRAPSAPLSRVGASLLDDPCPDPSSPDALRLAFERAYRVFWRAIPIAPEMGPAALQNVVAVFNAARLAYGIGKAAPADDAAPVDFSVLMGRKPVVTPPVAPKV